MNVSQITRMVISRSNQVMTGLYHNRNRQMYRFQLQTIRRFAVEIDVTCWKCKANIPKNQVICTKCGTLMTPDTTRNFFELLNVQESFDVNSTTLTQNFRQLQSVVHPDKFSNK